MASRGGGCSACKAKGCDLNRAGACICCRPPCIRTTEDTYLTTDGHASGSESERLHHHNTLSVIENSYSGPSETDSRTQLAETAENIADSLIPLKKDHIPDNIPTNNVITGANSLDTTLITSSSTASTVIEGAASLLPAVPVPILLPPYDDFWSFNRSQQGSGPESIMRNRRESTLFIPARAASTPTHPARTVVFASSNQTAGDLQEVKSNLFEFLRRVHPNTVSGINTELNAISASGDINLGRIFGRVIRRAFEFSSDVDLEVEIELHVQEVS